MKNKRELARFLYEKISMYRGFPDQALILNWIIEFEETIEEKDG